MSAHAMSDGNRDHLPAARFRFRTPVDALGYTELDAVFEDTSLDVVVRYTYLIVKQHAWAGTGTPLTTEEIARLLGRSPGQAYRALQELLEAGLLSVDPDGYCLEPPETRYGPAGPGRRPRPPRGPRDQRGAVLPITTDERRAFEDYLAFQSSGPAAPPRIDEADREKGLTHARRLREQLSSHPPEH